MDSGAAAAPLHVLWWLSDLRSGRGRTEGCVHWGIDRGKRGDGGGGGGQGNVGGEKGEGNGGVSGRRGKNEGGNEDVKMASSTLRPEDGRATSVHHED